MNNAEERVGLVVVKEFKHVCAQQNYEKKWWGWDEGGPLQFWKMVPHIRISIQKQRQRNARSNNEMMNKKTNKKDRGTESDIIHFIIISIARLPLANTRD